MSGLELATAGMWLFLLGAFVLILCALAYAIERMTGER